MKSQLAAGWLKAPIPKKSRVTIINIGSNITFIQNFLTIQTQVTPGKSSETAVNYHHDMNFTNYKKTS